MKHSKAISPSTKEQYNTDMASILLSDNFEVTSKEAINKMKIFSQCRLRSQRPSTVQDGNTMRLSSLGKSFKQQL